MTEKTAAIKCVGCKGKGTVTCSVCRGQGRQYPSLRACAVCHGRGNIMCPECKGTKKVAG